jgi:hypothetical protein
MASSAQFFPFAAPFPTSKATFGCGKTPQPKVVLFAFTD